MKKVVLSAVSILTVLFFISCGTKPAPEESAEIEAPETTEIEETDTDTEATDGEDSDESSYDNYEAFAKVTAARKEAIEVGAEIYTAELFRAIDTDYNEVSRRSESEDVAEDCAKLEKRYLTLADIVKAIKLKKKINEEGLAEYDQQDYDEGERSLAVIEKAYEDDTAIDDTLRAEAANAYASFNKVFIIAYKKIAQDERTKAFQAKQNADSVKAGISQKERYNKAVDEFKAGDSAYSMQNPESAVNHYRTAKDAFTALYEEVSAKRAEAQRRMEEAKKRVAEAEKFAAEADSKAPIREAVEGIENEETVLLEQDDYSADEAEITVDEVLEDEELKEYESESDETTDIESEEDAVIEKNIQAYEETLQEPEFSPESEEETEEMFSDLDFQDESLDEESFDDEEQDELDEIEDDIINDEISEAE